MEGGGGRRKKEGEEGFWGMWTRLIALRNGDDHWNMQEGKHGCKITAKRNMD